jgi:hypothetical protein
MCIKAQKPRRLISIAEFCMEIIRQSGRAESNGWQRFLCKGDQVVRMIRNDMQLACLF